MVFSIVYHYLVLKEDISAINGAWQKRIKLAIETKLTSRPEHFAKPLRKSLAGYRKLRVGDWRIIFRIKKTSVKIFLIAHRSRIYKESSNRL